MPWRPRRWDNSTYSEMFKQEGGSHRTWANIYRINEGDRGTESSTTPIWGGHWPGSDYQRYTYWWRLEWKPREINDRNNNIRIIEWWNNPSTIQNGVPTTNKTRTGATVHGKDGEQMETMPAGQHILAINHSAYINVMGQSMLEAPKLHTVPRMQRQIHDDKITFDGRSTSLDGSTKNKDTNPTTSRPGEIFFLRKQQIKTSRTGLHTPKYQDNASNREESQIYWCPWGNQHS